jgi:hypothetical protein
MNRGDRREPIFRTAADRRMFLAAFTVQVPALFTLFGDFVAEELGNVGSTAHGSFAGNPVP